MDRGGVMKKINEDLNLVCRLLRDAEDILFSILCESSITENSIKPIEDIGYTNIFETRNTIKRLNNNVDSVETYLKTLNIVSNLQKEFYYVSDGEITIFDLMNTLTEDRVFLNKDEAYKEVNRINDVYRSNYIRNNQEYSGDLYKVFLYNHEKGIFEEVKCQ